MWRGGATIFMRGVLKAHGVSDHAVWVADSFEGLPEANLAVYPLEKMGVGGRKNCGGYRDRAPELRPLWIAG